MPPSHIGMHGQIVVLCGRGLPVRLITLDCVDLTRRQNCLPEPSTLTVLCAILPPRNASQEHFHAQIRKVSSAIQCNLSRGQFLMIPS